MEEKFKRTYPDQNEIDIRGDAVRSMIKKDFLRKDVSYVEAKELPFIVGKIKQTDNTRKLIRQHLSETLDAVMTPVGSGKVAIVKRPNDK